MDLSPLRKSALAALCAWQLALPAGELALNVAEKYFVDDESGARFLLYDSHKSNFLLKGLPSGGKIVFDAPLRLEASGSTSLKSDAKTLSISAVQPYSSGELKELFSVVNGGVLASIELTPQTALADGESLVMRIRVPLASCLGRDAFKNGEKLEIPREKGEYVLCQGSAGDELRLGLGADLEFGIRLLDGVKSYRLFDARHHKSQEGNLYLEIAAARNSFSYFFALLKPGAAFPSASKDAPALPGKRRNLLGEGSDFEVGPKGFVATTSANWLAKEPPEKELFDSKEFHQGAFSLRLSNFDYARKMDPARMESAKRERNVLWFLPLKMEAGKDYVLSAWMKSDIQGGAKLRMSCLEQGDGHCGFWGKGPGVELVIGGEWKRHTLRFRADDPLELNYRNVQFMLSCDGGKGSVWIDEVQLEDGSEASDYMAEALEFGVSIERPYKLFTPEELRDASIDALFRNNGPKEADCEINYSIKDYWDKKLASGKIAKTIPANGNIREKIKFPSLPCGYYRAFFDSADGRLHDEAIFGVYSPVASDAFAPLAWPLGFQAEGNSVNPLARKLGFGWVRSWQFSFKNALPEKGKTDFEKLDIYVDRCEKAKLRLMPILGPALLDSDIPDWAVGEDRKSSLKSSWAKSVRFPRLDAWKTYVAALAGRYKGRVDAFELFNEPNCWITPDEYLPYLKATWEAAKEADRNALVAGGSTTSDLGQNPAPWTSRLIELGGAQYMDVLSVHMYSELMPERSLGNGTDKFLALLHEKLKAAGKDMPVWHTEKTHNSSAGAYSKRKSRMPDCFPHHNGYGFKVADFRAKAEYMLRETLIDSSVGKGPFFWFEDLLDRQRSPRLYLDGFGHIEFDGSPCPEILAANGLARSLEGRETPKELLKLGDSKYCALFEGPEGALAALWNLEGTSKIKLPKDAAPFELRDFFGEKAKPSEWLELATAPIYLLFDGRKAEDVKRSLLASEGDGPEYSVSGGLELEKGSVVLAVYLFNRTWRELETIVELDEIPGGWAFARTLANAKTKPAERARIVLPASSLKPSALPQSFGLAVGRERASLEAPPFASNKLLEDVLAESAEANAFEVAKGRIKIDADLSDWSEDGLCGAATAGKVKSGRDAWRGPMDLSVQARFRWDAENLYAAYEVYDDKLRRSAPAQAAWSSDCVEMFLGFKPDAKEHFETKNNTMAPGDFQLLFAPPSGEGAKELRPASGYCVQRKDDAGIKVASKAFEYGYIVEAAIPWKSFSFVPGKGDVLGMTYQATDTDAYGVAAEKTIYWAGEWSNCIAPRIWGRLKLR